jgi:Domain of unknown function (DUF1905)
VTVVVTVGVHTWRSSIAHLGRQFLLGVSQANREAARQLTGARKHETRTCRLEKVLAELRGRR